MDRDQAFLLPPDMASWLPAEHLVWFVLDVVAELDTSALHGRSRLGGAGRAGFDPDMLLALLVYGYAVGQRSSRRIEALCSTDVAFRVVCAQDAPDHTTIARFRSAHEEVFADLFAQVLVLCARAGMGRVGVVAIDGTKIAANAALSANRDRKWLLEQAQAITADIAAEAGRVDAAEDELFGACRGDELPEDLADRSGRRARIRAALEQASAGDARERAKDVAREVKRQEYLTLLRRGRPVLGPPPAGLDRVEVEQARIAGYTRRQAQADPARAGGCRDAAKPSDADRVGLASARRRLAAEHARRATADHVDHAESRQAAQQRTPENGSAAADKSSRTANVTDPDSRIMKTRGGWVQGYNAQLAVSDDYLILAADLTQDGTDTGSFTAMMTAAAQAAQTIAAEQQAPERTTIGVLLADAGYLSDANLTAPGPDRLIAVGKSRELHRDACEQPAQGPPPPGSNATEAMAHRLRIPSEAARYKRRAATVEPINAHLKDQVGLRRFSRRGLTAARSELHLAAAVVNLLKLHQRPTC